METNGSRWNILEATVSYKAWARLTPTLTHVVTYELVTSGAEDDAMSASDSMDVAFDPARALGIWSRPTHTEVARDVELSPA